MPRIWKSPPPPTRNKRSYLLFIKILKGGSSLDAVEVATRKMELCGVLNAGCGAYLTEKGTVELDAAIMDGQTLNTGK